SDVEDWLQNHGVDDGSGAAPYLVGLGLDSDRLSALRSAVGERGLPATIAWVSSTAEMHSLLHGVEGAATRISALVGALRQYTFLDRAPIQSVNVQAGIETTLLIMQNRLPPPARATRRGEHAHR